VPDFDQIPGNLHFLVLVLVPVLLVLSLLSLVHEDACEKVRQLKQ
jgi:hypothetical protein